MRDPERIDKILNTIRLIWTDCPDLRLGQLIVNAVGLETDLFNIEDDILNRELIMFGLEFTSEETEDKLLIRPGFLDKLLEEAKNEMPLEHKSWEEQLDEI